MQLASECMKAVYFEKLEAPKVVVFESLDSTVIVLRFCWSPLCCVGIAITGGGGPATNARAKELALLVVVC